MIALTVWLMRFLSKRSVGPKGRAFTILERCMLTKDTGLWLVSVGTRVLVLGVGKDSVSFLSELDPAQIAEMGLEKKRPNPPSHEAPSKSTGFWRRFLHNLKINMGLLPKGTAPMTPKSQPVDVPEPAIPDEAFAALLSQAQKRQERPTERPPVQGNIISPQQVQKYVEATRQYQVDHAPADAKASPVQAWNASAGGTVSAVAEEHSSYAVNPENYDDLFDKISKRQTRYTSQNDTQRK
jgi:flagellar biogenesis protein FliO